MTIRQVNPPGVYDPSAYPMSQAAVDERNGYVFVSGQVAWDVNGKVHGTTYGAQTELALENLAAVLAAAGTSPAEVVSIRVYLRGECEDHIAECVPPLAAFFGTTRPALTGIGVASLATKDTLVEIEVVARSRVA